MAGNSNANFEGQQRRQTGLGSGIQDTEQGTTQRAGNIENKTQKSTTHKYEL